MLKIVAGDQFACHRQRFFAFLDAQQLSSKAPINWGTLSLPLCLCLSLSSLDALAETSRFRFKAPANSLANAQLEA